MLSLLLASLAGGHADIDADALPPLRLEAEQVVGAEPRGVRFGRVYETRIGGDGRIYVMDGRHGRLEILSADGRLETSVVARRTPGEVWWSPSFGFLGDTLWVFDQIAQEIRFHSLDGRRSLGTIRSARVEIPSGRPTERIQVAMAEPIGGDRFLGRIIRSGGVTTSDLDADSLRVPLLVFDRAGSVIDTAGFHMLHFQPAVAVGRVTVFTGRQLPDEPLHAMIGADSITVERSVAEAADSGFFRLVRRTATDDTAYALRFRYAPVPVTPDFVEAAIESRLDRPFYPPADRREERIALETTLIYPPRFPPVSALLTGHDGSVWLRREADGADARWIVITGDGSPRGVLTLPRGQTVRWIDADHVWISQTAPDGTATLTRYRLVDG